MNNEKNMQHDWRRPLLSLLPLMLAACASPTAYQQPDMAVPAQWAQARAQATAGQGAQAQLSPWWLGLGDATLNQLINDALARNGDLALAAIKVRRARLLAGQAQSDVLPSVAIKGSTSSTRQLDGDGGLTRASSANVTASWELDLWGRLAALRNAADWEAQATDEDRRAAAMSLVGTVASLYWQVAYLNQRVEASQQSIDYARKTLELVQAQYKVGSGSGLDVAQAQQTLATQEATHNTWLQQRVEARNALALLFDQPPGAATNEAQRLLDGALPEVAAGLPASLLTRRPDLRAADLRLRKYVASVDATRTAYYPTLSLTGILGGSSDKLVDVLRNPYGTLGAGLTLPFVQWRDMKRNVAIAQADVDSAIVSYRQAWYQALADVENALSARQSYEQQGTKLEEALKASRDAERLSEARYRAGAVALKTWLDAQEARRQAENSLAQNRLNRLNALATLYKVLGGGMAEADKPAS
jgi:NodT family efflux transporter outer membrane factor (OMF) lipoprotein